MATAAATTPLKDMQKGNKYIAYHVVWMQFSMFLKHNLKYKICFEVAMTIDNMLILFH